MFDVGKVRDLVELMDEHDLSEIDLQNGKQKIRLRRGSDAPVIAAAPMAPAPVAPAPIPAAAPAATPAPAASPAPAAEAAGKVVTSPMVGTFYNSSSPEAAPFVNVGDQIGPDTTVCIIEAMKVFNTIKAETSGVIDQILVKDGDAVEFGQALFKVRPA
ncbi:MAG: acetyl-CoA carboxylase biotin carboxyl carrier protein [Planctomycetota bacterium]